VINRRELLGAAAAGAALVAGKARAAGPALRLDFTRMAPRQGWPGWTCVGAANLSIAEGRGRLEAATDVFPYDPRPVAFAVDRRFRDGGITAAVDAPGAGTGLVLRRTGHRSYLAAVLDTERSELVVVRRTPDGAAELGSAAVTSGTGPVVLTFDARGNELVATAGSVEVRARDDRPRAGDPGVLATARTLFPSEGPEAFPALGNLHLLPYGVQEGQAVFETAVGESVLASIRERSTAVVESIELRPAGRVRPTRPSVVAATGARPVTGGARVRVVADIPCRVVIEVSTDARFRNSRRVAAGRTDSFRALQASVRGLSPGTTVHWRARLHRRGRETVGPARRFRVPPRGGDRVRIAIGSCAAQFGPAFDRLTETAPDIFVWQGDLNYPDTAGPLAQTVPAYAGMWRELLANPRTEELFASTLFAVQRDDHDYGLQDANATNLVPWGLTPWEALMEARDFYRFRAGLAEVWVLDQRRFKSDPELPDDANKTLLGARQRSWLERTLARSTAPFKVICSPCTLAPLPANARDGSWAVGYTAERDRLLDHVAKRVSGQTVFVTGDTHWTMAYEDDRLIEVRPCPLGIPTPNDITLTQPQAAENARRVPGVVYAEDERAHFALLEVSRKGLDVALVREDAARPYERRFGPQ
jgi:hypothetical protein